MVYLLWAYVIIWVMLLIYIYTLLRKTQNLGKDINALRDSLDSKIEGERPGWRNQE